MGSPHPICQQMRALRLAAGWSLTQAEHMVGVSSIVLGSYERGDRQPPLEKVDAILRAYGYTLAAVPSDFDAVRLPADMAAELRAIAAQLDKEKNNDVSQLSGATASVS